MSRNKRLLQLNESFAVERKKLRTTSPDRNSRTGRLEDLPNEIFDEIFEYLEGGHIYKAFSKLTSRFQYLISHSSLRLKIKSLPPPGFQLENYCNEFIVPNRRSILSLQFENELILDDFSSHCLIDASFYRLESIVLKDITSDGLRNLLFHLKALPRLCSLTTHLDNEWGCNLTVIYRMIFLLPALKYNKLEFDCETDEELDFAVPLAANEQLSTIEDLTIDHNCTLQGLLSMLHHTPQLRRLSCHNLVDSNSSMVFGKLVMLSNLTRLSVGNCQVDFDEFEIFIKGVCGQLRVLNIKQFMIQGYLDGDRLERLIKEDLPHLSEFGYQHIECHFGDDDDDFAYVQMNQFTSPFWTERAWFFEVKISADERTCSIRSHKKMWFDDDDEHTSLSRSMKPGLLSKQPIIQLNIDDNVFDIDERYINRHRIAQDALRFTHLSIKCKDIPSEMLAAIIRLLPNLDSLKLSSLRLTAPHRSDDNARPLSFLTSISNKITKVYLENTTDIEQVNFLLHLCLGLQYFQLHVPDNMDLDMLVRFIIMKNDTFVPKLQCLCLCIPNANERATHHLQDLIESQRLLSDYTITHNGQKVLLQWKRS